MVGSIWCNILTSTILAVYTFILSITNNTPEHALFRGITIFVITFVIVYFIRKALFFVMRTNDNPITQELTTTMDTYPEATNSEQQLGNHEEVESKEAAERVRTMMQAEQGSDT